MEALLGAAGVGEGDRARTAVERPRCEAAPTWRGFLAGLGGRGLEAKLVSASSPSFPRMAECLLCLAEPGPCADWLFHLSWSGLGRSPGCSDAVTLEQSWGLG